jgi:ribosomal protein S18 acetylase RimI-like enzyme
MEELEELLQDAVNSGASIGFLPPLASADARNYWLRVLDVMAAGGLCLLVATENGRVIGCVQLELASMPNAGHRAEVKKLFVHTSARGQGVGRSLMTTLEDVARAQGRSLLVLDTRQGDPSEQLYLRVGYTRAGEIPRYARSASGELHTTAFYYKELG